MALSNRLPKMRRIRIRFAILTVIMLLLGGSLAAVSFKWIDNNILLAETIQQREARMIFASSTSELQETFGIAPKILNKYARNILIGVLPEDNLDSLGMLFATELNVAPYISWISFGTRMEGAFVGATRRNEEIILNQSIPTRKNGETQEWQVDRRGQLTPIEALNKEPFDPRNREWFYQGYLRDGVSWTRPYEFREGGIGITSVKAITGPTPASWIGTMTVDFDVDEITDRLRAISDDYAGSLLMVVHGKEDVFISVNNEQSAIIDLIRAEYRGTDQLSESGLITVPAGDGAGAEEYFFYASPLTVIEGLSADLIYLVPVSASALGLIYDNMFRVIALSGVFILVALIAAFFISRSIARPIEQLGDVVEGLSLDELDKYQPLKGHWLVEIDETQRTLNNMVAGLQKGEEIRSTFGRYIPEALAAALEDGSVPLELGGHEVEITAIFTDIEGFTTISESTSSKELVLLLNRYFEGVLDVIERNHGMVVDFIGDGIFAIFGAPIADPDHRDFGIDCALGLIERTEKFEQELAAEGIQWGRTRIGLHSGMVVAGNIGGAGRQKYAALGDVVNTTARIESLNKQLGTRMLASAATLEKAKSTQQWQAVGKFQLVGKTEGLEIFEAITPDMDPEALLAFQNCLTACHNLSEEAEALVKDYALRYGESKILNLHMKHAATHDDSDIIVLNKK